MIKRGLRKLYSRGPLWGAQAAIARVQPPRLSESTALRSWASGGRTIELGGPSHIFGLGGLLPLYDVIGSLDIIDYAVTTLWTETGETDRKTNRLIVAEASALDAPSAGYDLVLSSHVLEHMADPISALREWHRVVRGDGRLILVLPEGAKTFDRQRPITELAHLCADIGKTEHDATHFGELLDRYDYRYSELNLDTSALADLVGRNIETRFVHHHVFDLRLGRTVLEVAGFEVEWAVTGWPYHLVYCARPSQAARG